MSISPAAELRQRLGCVGFIEGVLFRKEPLGKQGKKLGEAVEPGGGGDFSDAQSCLITWRL